MRRETAQAVLGAILMHAAAASGQQDRAATHVSWGAESCLTCHAPAEGPELTARIARPCRELCVTCHERRDRHHPVGVAISRSVPLLLTREGTNTCVTCHDVTLPRVESTAWVSQSLFDRTIRRSRENRTFYFAMRNDRGQLCRNSH